MSTPRAEQIRMCLAEAGFIEGRDYSMTPPYGAAISPTCEWVIVTPWPTRPDLLAAIEKARELTGPYPSEPYVEGSYATQKN